MYELLDAIRQHGPHSNIFDMRRGSRTQPKQTIHFLNWAVTSGLVQEDQLNPHTHHTYTITKRGMRFVQLVNELKDFLEGVSSFPTETRYT